jgi:hypothetical protein
VIVRLVRVWHSAGRPSSMERDGMTAQQPPVSDLGSAASGARRPYQAPRILFREPLEAMAAICAPHPPAKANKGLCPMGPISS